MRSLLYKLILLLTLLPIALLALPPACTECHPLHTLYPRGPPNSRYNVSPGASLKVFKISARKNQSLAAPERPVSGCRLAKIARVPFLTENSTEVMIHEDGSNIITLYSKEWNNILIGLLLIYDGFHDEVAESAPLNREFWKRLMYTHFDDKVLVHDIFRRRGHWGQRSQALKNDTLEKLSTANTTVETYIRTQPFDAQQSLRDEWAETHHTKMPQFEEDMQELKHWSGGESRWETILINIRRVYDGLHISVDDLKEAWAGFRNRSALAHFFLDHLPMRWSLAQWKTAAEKIRNAYNTYMETANAIAILEFMEQPRADANRLAHELTSLHEEYATKCRDDLNFIEEIRGYMGQ